MVSYFIFGQFHSCIHTVESRSRHHNDNSRLFTIIFSAIQVATVILYGIFVEYSDVVDAKVTDLAADTSFYNIYPMFQDVHVMIFVGFGFLMTFLRKYSYGAVGFTFLIGAVCLQWGILSVNFWIKVISGNMTQISLTIAEFVMQLFGFFVIMQDSFPSSC